MNFSTISLTLTLVLSKVVVIEKDKGLSLYFTNPSILARIDLIPVCGSPHPPVGRLGTLKVTVISLAPEIPSFAALSIKMLTSMKMRVKALRFINPPRSSKDPTWQSYVLLIKGDGKISRICRLKSQSITSNYLFI